MTKKAIITIIFILAVVAAVKLLPDRQHKRNIAKLFSTPIEEIVSSPQCFENRMVTITGEVTHTGGIGKHSAYMVDDGSGSIWVLDKSSAPALGEKVKIRGQTCQWFRIGNKSVTVFKAVK